jgi:PTH1 family peptidyl-tRNA hydrolase
MKLFVGLGNPGPRYAGHRHNIGFMAVEAIAAGHGAAPFRARFQGEATEANVGGVKVLLLKPLTYMNESGRAVGEAMRFFKIALADVVVFHDELDLPPAKMRVKLGGGNAGHNGLRSISQHCGNEYWRVRLGIGHPGAPELVHSYVLNDFGRGEMAWVDDLCRAISGSAPLLASGQEPAFASKVHLAMEAAGHKEVKRLGEG